MARKMRMAGHIWAAALAKSKAKPMNIYTLERTPGATDTVKWMDICHTQGDFLVIDHSFYRNASRWSHVDRKRPFRLTHYSRARGMLYPMSVRWFTSLQAAQAASGG